MFQVSCLFIEAFFRVHFDTDPNLGVKTMFLVASFVIQENEAFLWDLKSYILIWLQFEIV